jgi:hypothetical protein
MFSTPSTTTFVLQSSIDSPAPQWAEKIVQSSSGGSTKYNRIRQTAVSTMLSGEESRLSNTQATGPTSRRGAGRSG